MPRTQSDTAAEIKTAIAEVGHHLRREAVARKAPAMQRTYRTYSASLNGAYLDIRGLQTERPELYAPDSYSASQAFREAVRAAGGAGIVYDSVRLSGGVNVAAYRPTNVLEIAQTDHLEISVSAAERRIEGAQTESVAGLMTCKAPSLAPSTTLRVVAEGGGGAHCDRAAPGEGKGEGRH